MNNKELPNTLKSYLADNGIRRSGLTLDTRLFHDLGIYGDEAWGLVEELAKRKVDLAGFEFERYFPPEFYGDGLVERLFYWLVPFASVIRRRQENYDPVTLGMIWNCLEHGKWIDSNLSV